MDLPVIVPQLNLFELAGPTDSGVKKGSRALHFRLLILWLVVKACTNGYTQKNPRDGRTQVPCWPMYM